MSRKKILIQLDTDPHASVFDRVVAVDAGVDELFSYSAVKPGDVEALVHGAIFTRKVSELSSTAIFVGGKNVAHAEELLAAVIRAFFGPFRVSVLMDASGANTTAAAAILAAKRHVDLSNSACLVLGGTGPVGQRVALLLAKQGCHVWLSSRNQDRARDVCDQINADLETPHLFPLATQQENYLEEHHDRFQLIVSAGAAGTRLLSRNDVKNQKKLRAIIDLNAVPPTGIEGVELNDAGKELDGIFQYGAIGVGGAKMKIHRAAVERLFHANTQVLDALGVFDIALSLEKPG